MLNANMIPTCRIGPHRTRLCQGFRVRVLLVRLKTLNPISLTLQCAHFRVSQRSSSDELAAGCFMTMMAMFLVKSVCTQHRRMNEVQLERLQSNYSITHAPGWVFTINLTNAFDNG